MISKIQPYNSNVNFQSRLHMDWHTAQYLETHSKESITGEFKHQLEKLKNNGERDVVFLKRLEGAEEDGFSVEVVTENGLYGESIVDNYYQTKADRKKIDIIGLYNEAKNSLKEHFMGKVGLEALNI